MENFSIMLAARAKILPVQSKMLRCDQNFGDASKKNAGDSIKYVDSAIKNIGGLIKNVGGAIKIVGG